MTTELLRRRPPDDVDDAFDIDSFKARSAPVSWRASTSTASGTSRSIPIRCAACATCTTSSTTRSIPPGPARDAGPPGSHGHHVPDLWNLGRCTTGTPSGRSSPARGGGVGRPRVGSTRQRLSWFDRSPAAHTVGSILVGEAWTAVHMTWGAVNEWTAQAGYACLGQLAQHPVLSTLLSRIMRQEGRHADFYARQAERRLRDDALARWLTRTAPPPMVGSGRLDAPPAPRGRARRRPPLLRARWPRHDGADRSPARPTPGAQRITPHHGRR